MARIVTDCPRCGHVELAVDEVTVVISPLQHTLWYLFGCGGCAHQVFKMACGPVVVALSRLGTPVWTVPAEVTERAGSVEDAPSLGVDDLLDAMLWLRLHDRLAALPAETMQG